MDFADVLDQIARPARSDDGPYRPGGKTAGLAFWRVLDRIGDAPPVSDETLKAAYFSEDFVAASTRQAALEERPEPELSIDPDDIAYELGLSDVVSLEELSVLRRRFAMLNHPDRVPPAERARATTRMTIANAMIDKATRRFSR